MKDIREAEDNMMAGQRGSRLAKWIRLGEESRKKAGLGEPEAIQTPGVF